MNTNDAESDVYLLKTYNKNKKKERERSQNKTSR